MDTTTIKYFSPHLETLSLNLSTIQIFIILFSMDQLNNPQWSWAMSCIKNLLTSYTTILGAVHKLRYAFFTAFWPPTHLWLCFCNDFTKYLLNKICNGYILLTTNPHQWHNVICERPPEPFLRDYRRYCWLQTMSKILS